MDPVLALLKELKEDPELGPRFRAHRVVEARPGRFADLPEWVRGDLRKALEARGIERLYAHQAEAVGLVREGKHTAVATPTASGKSLCYNLPVLDRALEEGSAARALYLFPTKALSRDQEASLSDLLLSMGREDINAAVYDGDTPGSIRSRLREGAHILITNPTMLHLGILPNHPKWHGFFRGLRYVVIDELHTWTGIYGSNAADVIRRLKRICAHYGSKPVFICCSATIGNPSEHAERILEEPVELVDKDSAPRGEQHFLFYNPPLLNPNAGLRESSVKSAVTLAERLLFSGIQSAFFCRSRNTVEVLTKYLKDLAKKMKIPAESVAGYRGGYLPGLRRSIETGLREGEIRAVVATNALELGVDIGRLDAVVMVGYPGSISSTWQRAGRAGRRGRPSLALMIAGASALDQYVVQSPSFVFSDHREKAAVDPDNLVILANQVKCAAFELPFRRGDSFGKAPDLEEILEVLSKEAGILHFDGERYFWAAPSYPAEDVSLDAAGIDNVVILDADTGKIIGEVDRPSSIEEVYQGAIYGHQGEQYLVEKFDYHQRRAVVRKVNFDYYTDAETETDVRVLCEDERSDFEKYAIYRVEVHVSTLATAYKKIRFYTHENVGAGEIHLPPEEMDTEAFVLTLGEEGARAGGLETGSGSGALGGLAGLIRRLAPLFVRCDPADLLVKSELKSGHWGGPAITAYDRAPGGVGLSETLFGMHREVLEAALEVVRRCPCLYGCPSCVGPVVEAGKAAKDRVRHLLEVLLG